MTSTKYLSMADNITKVTKLRNLAITHLIVGFLLFCFSVAEQVVVDYWTKVSYFGIWNGILVSTIETVKCDTVYSRNNTFIAVI